MLSILLVFLMAKLHLPNSAAFAFILTVPVDLVLFVIIGMVIALSSIRTADAVADFPERMPLRCVS